MATLRRRCTLPLMSCNNMWCWLWFCSREMAWVIRFEKYILFATLAPSLQNVLQSDLFSIATWQKTTRNSARPTPSIALINIVAICLGKTELQRLVYDTLRFPAFSYLFILYYERETERKPAVHLITHYTGVSVRVTPHISVRCRLHDCCCCCYTCENSCLMWAC